MPGGSKPPLTAERDNCGHGWKVGKWLETPERGKYK